jgi:hypothetical protein
MKYTAVIVLFLLTVKTQAQENINRAADEKALRYLKEVEWPKAYREQDTVLLDRILADEFQMISSDGNSYTKKDELEYIKKYKPGYDSFKFIIKRLEIFENNTAVVSGTGVIRNHDKDGEFEMTYQSSNVLIRRGNLWKAISSHTSGDKIVRIE